MTTQIRSGAEASTDLIPTGHILPKFVNDRLVHRRGFIDPKMFSANLPMATIPLREMEAILNEAYQSSGIRRAQQEILDVNRAALQALIVFAQAPSSSFADPDFSADFVAFYADKILLAEVKTTKRGEEVSESPSFGWTKKAYEIRQIAKRYSETTNADY